MRLPASASKKQQRRLLYRLVVVFILLIIVVGAKASIFVPHPAQAQEPTTEPAADPATEQTTNPTAEPTAEPQASPTVDPTGEPATAPTTEPPATEQPPATTEPTTQPTTEPPANPTAEPTTQPPATEPPPATAEPTTQPTGEPTTQPTTQPTVEASPTLTPTVEAAPTLTPTVEASPTLTPTVEASPTLTPTTELTDTVTAEAQALPKAAFAATAGDYTIQLIVKEYVGGAPVPGTGPAISQFTYLVNEDNAGEANNASNMPSTTPMASHSPLVATGNETVPLTLDNGRYLITVRADGYKLGGQHVTVSNGGQGVLIELVKDPLPLSKIRVHAFHDNQPVNGENDIPVEQGLSGFHVVVEDTVGEVTVDWFGNPLCTNYEHNPDGTIKMNGDEPVIDGGNPGGYCKTDNSGDLLVDALPRGKYEVLVIPPDGSDWVQTTTIEGTPVIDAWIYEGNDGYSPREGFQVAGVWVGFVEPMNFGDGDSIPAGSGSIHGTVRTIEEWTPPQAPAPPLVLTDPIDRPWIALTDIGNTDRQVYLGRGGSNGVFNISGVPDGTYQMAIWDENLDYIIAFYTVQIPEAPVFDNDNNPRTVDMNGMNPNGDGVGVPRWFGWFSGYVFLDKNQNGLRESGEEGLPGVGLAMRFRDGSLRYGAVSDNSGFYEFPEVFELEKFYVTEVGFTNMGYTGALVHDEFEPYDPNNPNSYEHIDGALTVSNLNWAAKRTTVDWGKYAYGDNQNGGISGIVQYATTRNEFEARLQATEDYEPGVPNVTVRLYTQNPNYNPTALPGEPNSDPRGLLINETQTDAWEHPAGCNATDSAGTPITTGIHPWMADNCIEVPNISNEVKEGVFDGGYAFETICPGGIQPGDSCEGSVDEIAIPSGDYIVEVVPPAGYKIVTEEDLNTADGNALVPALPPSGCVGDRYLMNVPDDYGSPFDAYVDTDLLNPIPGIDPMPLCDRRAVRLREHQNAAADFYLMTDNAVPIPGRIYGFLLDDLNIETDPNFIYYGEKRGIPHTSVGIRDFTGRLIKMLETDDNGIFEVLLPSTYVADCPIPSGVCPAMYQVVGNDPGDPGNPSPHFNPNYQTITFVFDVWPGKATYADVALFPITAFAAFPGSQFGQPAACTLPADMPQVYNISRVFYHVANGADPNLVITGSGFGTTAGAVTLGDVSLPVEQWSDTQITVDLTTNADSALPGGAPVPVPGPQQLLVTAANGNVSRTGLTFHVRGPGYDPPRRVVPTDHPTIQAAIDAANNGDLIIVEPGAYTDPFVLNKAVKLQGYGPGAPDGLGSGGTVLDQRFILNEVGFEVVGVGPFGNGYTPQIDGFLIMNARDEQDVGGGLYVNNNVDSLIVSNNIIRSNGGNFGGGIVVGQPYRGDNNNDNLIIHHNRILNNGGISVAGAVGIFNGADNYEVAYNDICGNYSGEYGGGISHFGLSHNGRIHHNRVYFNNAFDEGGGILVGGELPLTPGGVTQGSGAVDISHNLIQANLSNDDGGGLRLLQPWDYPIDIFNNIIVNNVSTDFGGGVALDDAARVTMVNNTIARNANTSTAEDSDGAPHAAGLAVETYSAALNAHLGTTDGYVDPVMFNNIICENQAYIWNGTQLLPNATDFNYDLEVFSSDPLKVLHPTFSLLTDPTDAAGQEDFQSDSTNGACGLLTDLFVDPYETELEAVAFRMEPNFIDVRMVTVNLPAAGLPHDYHINDNSAAQDAGIDQVATGGGGGLALPNPLLAPCDDIDNDDRPYGGGFDIGADETLVGDAPVDCNVAGPGLGVSLASNQIPPLEAFSPGQLTLQFTLKNTGELPDTYNLTASIDLAGATATVDPPDSVSLPNQLDQATVTVQVTIPTGVVSGTVATVEVVATSTTNPSYSSTAIDAITIVDAPLIAVPPAATFYMSFAKNGNNDVGSLLNVRDEDIVGLVEDNLGGYDYVMVLDGSNVGIGGGAGNPNLDITAFDILNDNTILMSFDTAATLLLDGAPTLVDDSDIVRFTPTSFGLNNTSGVFSLFLDGSTVGLTANGEDIDAIHLLEGDMLIISTVGNARVPADTTASGGPVVRAQDEDLLLFKMEDGENPNAGGTWEIYFDGSDIGLSANTEDVDGVTVTEDAIYLSTTGAFNLPGGFGGADADVFVCQLPTIGANSACSGFNTFFIGANFGINFNNGRDLNGIDIP